MWLSWGGALELGRVVMGWGNGVRYGCHGVGQWS